MAMLRPVRKACPACGRPMKAVRDEALEGRLRYACTNCDDDPLHDPTAILLDEPLTGLDPRGIRTMKQSVRDRAAAGAAIVVSSHLLALVDDLCTHLLIMHRGRQLFCGPVAEARTAFAAGIDADASLEEVFFRATEGAPADVG